MPKIVAIFDHDVEWRGIHQGRDRNDPRYGRPRKQKRLHCAALNYRILFLYYDTRRDGR